MRRTATVTAILVIVMGPGYATAAGPGEVEPFPDKKIPELSECKKKRMEGADKLQRELWAKQPSWDNSCYADDNCVRAYNAKKAQYNTERELVEQRIEQIEKWAAACDIAIMDARAWRIDNLKKGGVAAVEGIPEESLLYEEKTAIASAQLDKRRQAEVAEALEIIKDKNLAQFYYTAIVCLTRGTIQYMKKVNAHSIRTRGVPEMDPSDVIDAEKLALSRVRKRKIQLLPCSQKVRQLIGCLPSSEDSPFGNSAGFWCEKEPYKSLVQYEKAGAPQLE
jgi:hypothetical protein